MQIEDIFLVIKWWLVILAAGVSLFPLTASIFSGFKDRGYIFSKVLGIGILSYIVFTLGTFHILSFSRINVILILGFLLIANFISIKKRKNNFRKFWKIVVLEEIVFLVCLFLWSYVRSFQPSIHELEKFMDFGFINSILRSDYFPPKDIWLTPLSINYYYFGHLIIAVLTKLSNINSSVTFNLSVATIFAFTFACSFSIGANLISKSKNKSTLIAGFLTAFFVTFAGNLQTIYSFFTPYAGENAQPFWQFIFSPNTFPNSYWYPNATRFIYHTIHEFPIYSFVVSDLHAHVLSIPFVFATIAILLSIFQKNKIKILSFDFFALGLMLAILYMTNTWDIVTYFLLSALAIGFLQWRKKTKISITFKNILLPLFALTAITYLLTLPFSASFKPFAFGIGVLCPPEFLINIGNIGPFIFEADHCQRSPIWQLLVLYGFFFFWILSFIIFLKRAKDKIIKDSDVFILLLIILSIALIVLPEFVYVKDIYTAHYRANTMFKFTYQAFILLSISSAYIAARVASYFKSKIIKTKNIDLKFIALLIIGSIGIFFVFLYPYFAINSYYGGLKTYQGLDGTLYLKTLYSNDYNAINWINKNIKGQPVILEAQGDSYTDFARISASTGLPTVLGWTVHEWLWRGSYSVPAPRITDIQTLYQTNDISITKQLINKYNISYVYIGDMERQKYPDLDEEKFQKIGTVVFQSGTTRIYKINKF